jgi:N-acetylglucosamine malate deacetylase 2
MSWQANQRQSRSEFFRRRIERQDDPTLQIAVLAAHPDDETIGVSALLARFPQSMIVYVTDGAPRDRSLWPPGMACAREEYAEVRRREAARALAHAGIGEEQISWLGAADQEAILEARTLALKVGEFLRERTVDLLITHPYEGGHPDHDSAALIARRAISMLDSAVPELLEMTSYHVRNGECVTGEFLNPEPSTEIVLELLDEDRERKRKMMEEYSSQRLVLQNFPITSERLRMAPEYDFSQPPHEGKLWYECMGWPMTGRRWRELALAAFADSRESSCD